MNKFVKTEYDKFKQKTVVELKEEIELDTKNSTMYMLSPKIGFRQIKLENEPDTLVMDIVATSKNGLNLANGQLQLIADDRHLSFEPHESFSDPYLDSFHIESDWYKLDQGDLKIICDANSLEVRVTNGDEHADLSLIDKLQWGARVMYNALYDNTAYVNEILTPGNMKEQKEYIEKHKSGLIWTWVLGVIAIIIGVCCAWWLVVLGAGAIGIYQYCFSKKKNDIINSTALE